MTYSTLLIAAVAAAAIALFIGIVLGRSQPDRAPVTWVEPYDREGLFV